MSGDGPHQKMYLQQLKSIKNESSGDGKKQVLPLGKYS